MFFSPCLKASALQIKDITESAKLSLPQWFEKQAVSDPHSYSLRMGNMTASLIHVWCTNLAQSLRCMAETQALSQIQ